MRLLKRQNGELLGTAAKARQDVELLEALTKRKFEAVDEVINHALAERGQVLEALRDRVAEIGAA